MPKTDLLFRHWCRFVSFRRVKTVFKHAPVRPVQLMTMSKCKVAVLSWPHEFIPLPVSDSCQCSVPLIMEKH